MTKRQLINKKAKIVFDMLGFQYKPLQKKMLQELSAENKQKYINMDYVKKLIVLDVYAKHLGL